MNENPKIVIFGAGAVGQTVGGWIAQKYQNIYFVSRGEALQRMKTQGVSLYKKHKKKKIYNVPLNVIENIEEIQDADIIIICVKNYSLNSACGRIKSICGDKPYIIGLQNGIENQHIIPKYFSKVIYGVVGYNAWFDSPGILGYQKKGPIILGTTDNSLMSEMNIISTLFNLGVETLVVDYLNNAVHTKLIINLTNSIATLVGHGFREISELSLFQKILSNLLYEGTIIANKIGIKECKIGEIPSWTLIKLGVTLPQFITKGMFKRNVRKMVMNSMTQDVIQRGNKHSELDSINGYFIKLAEENDIDVPYNSAIYKLCKSEFSKKTFTPLDIKYVWSEIEKNL